MKITTITFLAALGAVLVLLSCNRKTSTKLDEKKDKTISLSEEFVLKIDEKAATSDGKFAVKATSVRDSRCPKGVQCIRAGEAFVELWLKTENKEETLRMATPSTRKMGGFDQITFDGYTIKLQSVAPYPEQPKPENPEETTVTLMVNK